MSASASSLAQLTRKGVKPTEALSPNAAFKRKYGIPPKGKPPKGGWADSDYGFPVPPATHPQAVQFAHGVLSRAHMSKQFSAAALAKQVRKAQAILKQKNKDYKPGKSPTAMAKSAQESGRRESLHFEGRLREGGVNLEKGTARIIVLRAGPGNAADKHYYTPECLEEAVERKIFESAQCYIDHPTKLEDQIIPERMVEKLAGWLSDVEMGKCENEQGVTVPCIEATFYLESGNELVLNKLRAAQQYAASFDGAPYLGFSINASGVGAPAEIDGQEYNRVDRITEAISVDMVTRAGAGGKLLQLKESQRKASGMKKGLKTNLVRSVKGAIKEVGINLSKEQDEELDKALGIVDGGALDNLVNQITMGTGNDGASEDEEAEEDEEDGLDGAQDDDEQNDGAAAGDEDDSQNGSDAGDDGNDGDDDINDMDESALKAALRAARKKEREAKKAAEKAAKEAKEARREAQRAKIVSQGIVRERARVQIFDDLKIPVSHRAILERHLRQDTTAKEMRETTIAYAKANGLGGDPVPGAAAPKAALVTIDCLAD